MAFDNEMLQAITTIYKIVYENPGIHRNTIRKKILAKGAISSKEKFSKIFESLLALGKISMDKELVTLSPQSLKVGVLQKERDSAYIVTPNSKKHYKVSKSVSAGYKSGDLLDIVIEYSGAECSVIILGRSQRVFSSAENSAKKEQKVEVETPAAQPQSAFSKENLVLGRVVKLSHDELVFIPNKKSFPIRQIPILNNKEEFSAFQDKLCIMNLINLDSPLLGGYIVEVKGDAGNPIHEYDAIAESYGAIMSWEGEGLKREIDKIPTSVDVSSLSLISEAEAKNGQRGKVVDLRHIPFVTVDPATCKDMDDAIYSTFDEDGNFVVYTAVANVTKYVDVNSEIGKRYLNAGFTIYAPNKAYGILPNKLSTGICSLNPNEDRLSFVVKSVIDSNTGKVKSSSIYDALIQSRKKYSYEEAQAIVDSIDSEEARDSLCYKILTGEGLSLEEQILMNYYAAQIIKYGFDQRRMIRFVSNKEREIKFDSDLQDVVDIEVIPHIAYHEVIEEFMVTANEAAAKYANDRNLDVIYRVHDEPNARKLERANEFFSILGVEFEGDLSAQGTRALIELIRNTANEEVINNFLIKMQSRAVYSDKLYADKDDSKVPEWVGERISHYALQSPHYSHTTAIIRRICDYAMHYNILADIHGTEPLSKETVLTMIETANERQLDVDQAEKDFDDISSVLYCEKHIGDVLKGRITKIRTASLEEGYDDEIVVIVRNEEKGISAEIPLSQILGRPTYDCSLSSQRCAVYDGRGNVVLTLCKPIDFIIEKADRKTMIVVGKTNKTLVKNAEERTSAQRRHNESTNGYIKNKGKVHRMKRFEEKKKHDIEPERDGQQFQQ